MFGEPPGGTPNRLGVRSPHVVVPYTTPHPATERTVGLHAPHATWVNVDGPKPVDYWTLLDRMWSAGQSFVVIEHDIELRSDVLPGFAACDQPWCVHPYTGPGRKLLTAALGCVRFTDALIEAEPDLIAHVGTVSQGLPAKDWRRLDVTVADVLQARGYIAHQHDPPVTHHHAYPFGCSCGDDNCPPRGE